jgi:PIN domain nuclease of toxin-antitoxin system
VRVLLDTHVFLWWFAAPERLGRRTKRLIGDGRNEVLVSAASCWEMAIKAALGKLQLPEPVERYVPARLAAQGMGVVWSTRYRSATPSTGSSCARRSSRSCRW